MAVVGEKRVPTAAPVLDIRDLRVAGAGGVHPVLNGVSMTLRRGEIVAVLGPEGAGKSTLLRAVAGRAPIASGTVEIDGAAASPEVLGAVFPEETGWAREDVAGAIAMPLDARGLSSAVLHAKVADALAAAGAPTLSLRPTAGLSDGERFRVALARALVTEPRLLLIDEPFAAFDVAAREEMRLALRGLGRTVLLATQDQESAFAVAHRLVVMRGGRIVESGDPLGLYRSPCHPFTARFLGQAVLVEGRRVAAAGEGVLVDTDIGPFVAAQAAHQGERGCLMIRPEFIEMAGQDERASNMVAGRIRSAAFVGKAVIYMVEVGSRLLRVERPATRVYTPGEPVRLRMPAERCGFLPRDEG